MNNKKMSEFCIKFVILLLFLCELSTSSAYAKKTIVGCFTDSETGETLTAAHIRIIGTRSGAISNDNGEYILELEKLPSAIQISDIGYNTEKITINFAEEVLPKLLNSFVRKQNKWYIFILLGVLQSPRKTEYNLY